jgi:ABC-type transporter Mla subunit MlaD
VIAQDERLTRRVGAVSLAVIATAIVFFVFVYDRIEWGRHVRVRVYFHHAGSLREGAPFVVAGRTVGKVESIVPVPRGAKTPLGAAANGSESGVVATVAIDASEADRLDASGDIFVASRGALSERYLELGPPAPDTSGRTLHENDELVGRDPPSLDRVLQRTWDNMVTLRTFASEVKPELDALRTQIDALRSQFDTTATTVALPNVDQLAGLIADASTVRDEIAQLRERGLGGEAGRAHIEATVDRAKAVVAATRASLDKLDASATQLRTALSGARGRLGPKVDQLVAQVELAIDRIRGDIAKVDPLLAEIDAINTRIARGEGSILKLMHDPEFPEDAKELGKIMKRQPWKIINRPPDKEPSK